MTVVMLAYGSHLPPALLLFLWAYNALPEMPDIPFSTAETTVAIMAGCLPLVSSFYKFHVERHVSQITVSLTGTRSRESKERQARKPHHPLSISTTELVSTDVALEEFRRA